MRSDLLWGFERVPGGTPNSEDIVEEEYTRKTISFGSLDGTPLSAWCVAGERGADFGSRLRVLQYHIARRMPWLHRLAMHHNG